jgi:alpha-ketoglutarate-dependent taurine dioxygenase
VDLARRPILAPVTDLEVTPLATTLGALVSDIDLAADLNDSDVAAVRRALLDHKVVFFRKQVLDPASQTRLATRFGEPTPAHPVEPSVEGHPEVLSLDSDEGARADVWHSDLTFQERPPLGAILHAVVVPAVGGDTIWADMAATYEALSPALRQFLDTLTASHTASKAGDYFASRDSDGDKAARTMRAEPVHHPVVRVHPETGGRSVFVNPLFTAKIDGLRRRESDTLLGLLHEVATQPERLVRWRWEVGDVAFWDNRCTMHYALLDYTAPRRMERVALEGDRPMAVSAWS